MYVVKSEKYMPIVSVIVPVYNAEKYLRRCIDSLVNQTLKDIEIILVDDGSTDGSLSVCNEYAEKCNNIKILTQNNQGPSVARNNALNIAEGKYIGFVDSDDFIEKETYEIAVNELEKNSDINLVIWGVNVISDDNLPYINWFQDNYFKMKNSGKKVVDEKILFKTAVVPWNKLYRTSIIKEKNITFPEGKLYEDNAFWWKYIVWCKEIFFLDKNFHYYNMRAVSLRGEVIHKKSEKEQDRIFMVENVYDYYQEHKLIDEKVKCILDMLFFNSFFDAYKETTDKIGIILLGAKLAQKMDLKNSAVEKVRTFANFVENKKELLSSVNNICKRNNSDEENHVDEVFLAEEDISKYISSIKEEFLSFLDNKKNDMLISQDDLKHSQNTMSLLIKDYMKKINLSDEYAYMKDLFLNFPLVGELPLNSIVSECISGFLSELYRNHRTEELIKFGKIFLLFYPDDFEIIRILGDTYLFLKKEPQKAFLYYKKYIEYIKDNDSVYNVMSDICGQNGDVFNQLIFKEMACQCVDNAD